jgi:hypothetical protein
VTTTDGLRYIDSDGHILEHPTGMPDYAPAAYRDRIWHIETDESGQEWLHYNGGRTPANYLASAGTAGLSDEERERAFRGELRYTEVRPAAYNAKARLQDMDTDGIDLAVLYPTSMLGLQSIPDELYEAAQLDGAGARAQFVHVTLPSLGPTFLFVGIMTMIGQFQIFAEPYVMTQGGPLRSTVSVVMLMYEQGFRWWRMGYATAIAFILFLIMMTVTMIQMWLQGERRKS